MHDQNFKNLILDYPVQSLEFFVRAEAGGMELSQARIIPLRQEQSVFNLSPGALLLGHGGIDGNRSGDTGCDFPAAGRPSDNTATGRCSDLSGVQISGM